MAAITALTGRRAWLTSAILAGAFSFVTGVLMLTTHLVSKTSDPLQWIEFTTAKEQLRISPKDEKLKQHIRELDLQLRSGYFRQLGVKRHGVWYLLAGTAVFIVAGTQTIRFGTRLPNPQPKPNASSEARRAMQLSRWAVTVFGFLVASGLLAFAFGARSTLPPLEADLRKLTGGSSEVASGNSPDAASPEDLQRNWPRFRGFDGSGVAIGSNFPVRFDDANGENILWIIPTPALGYSSPVVWGNRVFFSGAEAGQGSAFCIDGNTGKLLWQQPLKTPGPASAKSVPDSNVFAAATMATDGRRLYAIFGNGELGAFSFDGKPIWSKALGVPDNPYGHVSSLATWRDTLIVQLDQADAEAAKSRLYAIDGRSGQVHWQRPRSVPSCWASPIIIEVAGKTQIITLADPWVIAYAANDGAELWRAECLHGEVLPSAIFADGLLFVVSPAEKLVALRADGSGDVTKTHVVWTTEDSVPDITSPVSNGELVFTITSGGLLTCFDAKTGAKQWEHDFETEFYASPSIAGGRLYLIGLKGSVFVVEAARQFKEIFRTQMDGEFQASPAFADSRIYLRGVTNFICLGTKAEKLANN